MTRSPSPRISFSEKIQAEHNIRMYAAHFGPYSIPSRTGLNMAVISSSRRRTSLRNRETAPCISPGRSRKTRIKDITGQTREMLGHIDRLLTEANNDKAHLFNMQIYYISLRPRELRRHECCMGHVGRRRQHAAASYRRSQARKPGLPGRNLRHHRAARLIYVLALPA
ncbi:hypothetical protein BPMI_00233c [Candidatus Burkholderia pumila]|uniref:Uncharacterized protein n=1 Tax=Candidatus Burkholderia pumila TaxID=1090375 RepID=A0ABR5HLI4_9BURK|nr:hypothetical protein BPMI_00233c [Candidatus Burkholderia pumila]